MSRPRVTVYIPNLDGGARLERALESLHRQTLPNRVVLIDNGSHDGSPTVVRERFPDVEIIGLTQNVGFGRALNLGVAQSPADLLVFVNNDVECEPRFVEALVESVTPATDMVGGVLLQQARPTLIDSAGAAADQTLLPFDYLHGEPVAAAEGAPPPLGPTGGAALFRFEAFRSVGGFDDRIFAYLEDIDLAVRLRYRGCGCSLAAHARAIHRHSSTLGSGSAAKNYLMGWSRGYMLRRYGIMSNPGLAARAIVAEAVIAGGQVFIDRNASGLRGRIEGWHAAHSLSRRPFSQAGLSQLTLAQALRIRMRRRTMSVHTVGASRTLRARRR